MNITVDRSPGRLIVLRQVEGARWCVVEHALRQGKHEFAARIATARDYPAACRIALDAARRMKLPLGIQATGSRLRPFAPLHDMLEKEAAR